MTFFFPNGLSSKATAPAVLRGRIYTSAKPVWVDSVGGSDAYDGSESRPYATLGAADAAGRIVILKSGHAETYTGAVTLTAGCTVIGEETTGGAPACTLANNQSNGTMYTLSSVANVEFKNVKFPVETQSNASSRFTWTVEGMRFIDCVFEDSSLDANGMMDINGDHAHISGCTFNAAGTSLATAPSTAIVTINASGDIGTRIDGCTFDNGQYGRSAGVGTVDLQNIPAKMENVSCLGGARVATGSASEGYVSTGTMTKGGGIDTDNDYFYYPNGLAAGIGDDLLTKPILTNKDILYVSSTSGDDTNDGTLGQPVATLSAALVGISFGSRQESIVVLLDGHTETISTGIDLDTEGTVVVGEGTATLNVAVTSGHGITVSGASCELRNITIARTVGRSSSTSSDVDVTADGFEARNCTFTTASGTKGFSQLRVSGPDHAKVLNCSFSSSSGVGNNGFGMYFVAVDGLYCSGCTVDGGISGYSNQGGYLAGSPIRVEGLTIKNGCQVIIPNTSTGYAQIDADATCEVQAF